MVAPTLLESVRVLPIADKLALIEAISQMLQDELQRRPYSNGHTKVQPPDTTPPNQVQPRQGGNQDIKAVIAELLSRPDPTPEQMLPRGLLKGLSIDEEDFLAAEWHPSEKELLGE
ncbi:MAG: hypothetical protein R3C14_39230 [Caldilineaceae bacterium]